MLWTLRTLRASCALRKHWFYRTGATLAPLGPATVPPERSKWLLELAVVLPELSIWPPGPAPVLPERSKLLISRALVPPERSK